MSFVRASVSARTVFANARRYSTAPSAEPKPSNLPFYLLGGGVAGIIGYIYLDRKDKAAARAAAAATKPKISDKSALDPQNFVDFKLKKVEPYNYNTAKYIFELPADTASLMPIASCVVVKSAADAAKPLVDDKGKPVIRPYTPISPPDQAGELTFLIKRYENGKMSKYIHELKPGEALSIKGPIPKFDFKINQFDEVGMVAGGSGITPMYQILEYALKDPANKTRFTLIFANVTEKDILLKEEFDALKAKYPSTFDVVYTLDKPGPGWQGPSGYVSSELVTRHLPAPTLGEKAKIFVCGPPGQVAALAGPKAGMKQGELSGILKQLGYTPEQVFKF
ncbi:ferredoxin reductase-like C-terminal NADP-linked domain-containing protein [Trametes elegans]|nr:ferredoxin reductase-like C-terminal NADP-linked domain-containing protein [Trametes elegans]